MFHPVENEIVDCLSEMKQLEEKTKNLQSKMEGLQQEKNAVAAEEVLKKQTVNPNMETMRKFLTSSRDLQSKEIREMFEATFNLLLIQQKKIEELETQISLFNGYSSDFNEDDILEDPRRLEFKKIFDDHVSL